MQGGRVRVSKSEREKTTHYSIIIIIINNLYVCTCFDMATNQPFDADACGLPK